MAVLLIRISTYPYTHLHKYSTYIHISIAPTSNHPFANDICVELTYAD